jgi:hypothetical protein
MRAYLLFTGSGPILILTTFESMNAPGLVAKLGHKGIAKFIAYEVPLEATQRCYGATFEVVASDLAERDDLRVLDFNGHNIFANFRLEDLGATIRHENNG